ncbi:MAG: protein kinase [Planctomycetaceae bacterium]
MPFQLTFTKGPEKGRSVPLETGRKLTVGRGDDCDLQVLDPHVSRNHLRLDVGSDTVVLVDAGGRYGTRVNGTNVKEQRLKPGDVIEFGETAILFGDPAQAAGETLQPQGVEGTLPPKGVKTHAEAQAAKEKRLSDPRLDKLVGTTLVRYKIGEPIARGRSGLIFRAIDTKYDRPVALKVLWPELSGDETEVQRFVRAIKTMLPVKHENIVRIHGAGVSDGYCWMAMELVEGESVAQLIDRIGVGGMLDWESAFRIAYHIAQALAVANEHKIVHRNITPHNILIRGKDKVTKLGDLMLAKALEGSMAESITRPGELVGELPYMSPEQTTGQTDIDCRSDIYNLGATIYRLVTGRVPFEGRNAAETIRKIQTDEPEKPTRYQLSIHPLFEGVILQMIARNRDLRYATPEALILDLKRVAKFHGMKEL